MTLRYIIAFFILKTSTVFAMCSTNNYDPVIWNTTGNAFVIHNSSNGPEGGGSSSYIILNLETGESETILVSSNFSPGDGSNPEYVSVDECKSALRRGNEKLTKLGFLSRFNDNFFTCRFGRSKLLSIKDSRPRALPSDESNKMRKNFETEYAKLPLDIFLSRNGLKGIALINNKPCQSKCLRLNSNNGLKITGNCE